MADRGFNGSEQACRHQFLQNALVRDARWAVKLRWLAGAVIIAGTIFGRELGITEQTAALLVIGLIVLGYNSLVTWASRGPRRKS